MRTDTLDLDFGGENDDVDRIGLCRFCNTQITY